MNKRTFKILCHCYILGLAFITTVAVCDRLDKQVSERHTAESKKISKPVTYYTSATVPEYKPEVTGFSIISGTVSIVGHETPNIVRVDSDVITDDSSYVDNSEIETELYESLELPQGDCSAFLYMDYRAITDTASKQWELQQFAWTDSDGFRRIGDDYCVALGTYYGEIGDRFIVTTDKGNSYSVIMSDAKGYDAVSYDGYKSWYHVCGDGRLNVVEFICDTDCLDSFAWTMGDCGVLDNIGGNVVSIERID